MTIGHVLGLFIAATGGLAFGFSVRLFVFAVLEIHALKVQRLNGQLEAIARQHITISISRLLACSVSVIGGIVMIRYRDEPLTHAALISSSCWLFYNVMMVVNLWLDHRARRRIAKAHS